MKSPSNHHSGTWQIKSSLAIARSHPATAVYENKIYVFGGGGSAFKSLNTVEVYDPLRDRWSAGKEMPTLRSGAIAITLGNRIYVIGGGFKKPDGKFRFLPTMEVYNPKTDTWEQLTPMAIARHGLHGATCAVIGNMVHVPGGGPVPGGQVQGAYHDAFTFG